MSRLHLNLKYTQIKINNYINSCTIKIDNNMEVADNYIYLGRTNHNEWWYHGEDIKSLKITLEEYWSIENSIQK